ncbi:MAG: DUF177 domain-containing protein [Actinomycetota bacterium]
MAQDRDPVVVDLRALDVASGAGRRIDLDVPVDDLSIAGQAYRVTPGEVPVRLDVSRSPSGWLFRLRLAAEVHGPCFRCLGDARVPLAIDTREFAATGRTEDAPFDEDLDSEYLEGERLHVATWARDAIVEAIPDVITCRADCAGICPTCGADLNAGPCGCPPAPAGDPRWGPLAGLAERLRAEEEGDEEGPAEG